PQGEQQGPGGPGHETDWGDSRSRHKFRGICAAGRLARTRQAGCCAWGKVAGGILRLGRWRGR
ncbi:MAG: hypothetical protein ACK56F_02550, partial [bacterium]